MAYEHQGFVDAENDLAWLYEHGALAGVAEILRERRRQVEKEGYTPGHDDYLMDASGPASDLALLAMRRLRRLRGDRQAGIGDPASDQQPLREAGALCAAEIGRLNRLAAPGEPEVIVTVSSPEVPEIHPGVRQAFHEAAEEVSHGGPVPPPAPGSGPGGGYDTGTDEARGLPPTQRLDMPEDTP